MNSKNQEELNNYINSIKYLPKISKEREKELTEIIANSSDNNVKEKAIRELFEANLFLVIDMAVKKNVFGMDVMDLIYAGNLALLRSARKYSYNHESGSSFSTFAFAAILNAFSSAVIDNLIHLPRKFAKFSMIIKKFETDNKTIATASEIASLLEVSLTRAKIIRRGLDLSTSSFETLATEYGNWEDLYGEEDLSLKNKILSMDLFRFINKLKPKYKEIINLMYLEKGLDHEGAGLQLGCSKQNVDNLCQRAMREIKVMIMKDWDCYKKSKTILMKGKDVDRFKRKKKRGVLAKKIIEEEDKNKNTYKEVVAHYLGK